MKRTPCWFPACSLPRRLLAFTAALTDGHAIVVQRASMSGIGRPNFTGAVRVDGRFQGSAPARISGGTVTFEPGARTAWHTHPLGQTLIVTAGVGLVQHWGGAIQEIRPGDVVWISARREALARRGGDYGHDACRHTRKPLDGKTVGCGSRARIPARCNHLR